MSANPRKDFEERRRRVLDATALREPDRVPVIPVMEAFPIYYGGGTVKEILSDYRAGEAWFDKFYADFKPDLGWDPVMFYPSRFLEILGITWLRWPGKHIDEPNGMYQFIEGEYMKADEYEEAAFDPTQFMLSRWFPRSFANLPGLAKLSFRGGMWSGYMGTISAFGDPEVKATLARCMEAADIINEWFAYLDRYRRKMEEQFGIPLAYTNSAFAPFDMVGDTMRGTEGVLIDMIERPEQLLAYIDKVATFALQDQIRAAVGSGRPWVWFWLHKGGDEFMSDAQYARFYWPSLLRYVEGLVAAGLTPVLYCEGSYHTRLRFLKELPRGKVICDFESMDMARAKKELGDIACIAGNVPNMLLSHGSKREVVDATRRLIDTCAPGGGFMLDTGALVDDAKPENLMAIFETAETYGKRGP